MVGLGNSILMYLWYKKDNNTNVRDINSYEK